MTKSMTWGATAMLVVLCLQPTPPAIAQTAAGSGMVTGKTFAPVARGSAVSVEPEDDTDLNLRLKPVIAAALKARGYRIVANAKVRFIYNAESPETRRLKRNLRRSAERGSAVNRDPRQRTGPIRNPLIRQGLNLSGQPLKPGDERHLVSVIVLNDSGSQYWVGTAHVDRNPGDSFGITSTLSRQLVRNLGRTVKAGRFKVN